MSLRIPSVRFFTIPETGDIYSLVALSWEENAEIARMRELPSDEIVTLASENDEREGRLIDHSIRTLAGSPSRCRSVAK